jgi:hypothetical protein
VDALPPSSSFASKSIVTFFVLSGADLETPNRSGVFLFRPDDRGA